MFSVITFYHYICYNISMDNESKIMWCAGFFQGEGYVGTRKSQNMALDIAITQYYDRTPLDKFKEYIGGGNVNGPYKNSLTDECFQYRKTGIGAEEILKKIMPYLSGKKLKQAEKALQEIELYRKQRGGFNKKK